ncbi:hypothetical protein EDB92DRAFT_683586 [Lactarius akahatsu]|uniref:DUF6535 domain-containing protein n=1 Tax=Lactarius akahatsu TaxID=416441 RepID=A0AAD4QDM5_9AGAM|nr:hypothetical protein EDB92DRAFT_683586 [Lactarius akahatsu]
MDSLSSVELHRIPMSALYNIMGSSILHFTISSMSSDHAVPGPHGVSPRRVLPFNMWPDSQSDSQNLLLPTRMPTQASDSEVDLPNRADAHARESAEGCDRVEDWCGHANVVTLLSALLLITVATFFSRCYMTSRSNPHEILAFYLTQVRKFFGGSSGGATTAIALPATSFSKPLVTCAVMLTCVLWLASLTVGLACVVFSTLLRQWIPRYADVDRPRYGLRSPEIVIAFAMQQGSVRNVEAVFRILREWLLVAVFLFLWGLDIRLLHSANSPPPLVVLGLSVTFFTGLCLILAACPRFPSSGVETIPV